MNQWHIEEHADERWLTAICSKCKFEGMKESYEYTFKFKASMQCLDETFIEFLKRRLSELRQLPCTDLEIDTIY